MNQLKSGVDNVVDNVVNNAQKSFQKFKSIFKQNSEPSALPQNNMTIKESDTNQIFHSQEDNYDIDEDEQYASPSNKSPSNQLSNIQTSLSLSSSSEYSEPDENIWYISHRIYPKKTILDIEHLPYVNFIKRKKVENVLSFIGFSKPSNQIKEIKYLALFDESFIYMIKMSERENNQNNFNKKIGNHFDMRMISNMQQKDDEVNGIKCITLLFILDNDINDFKSVVKNFYMQTNDAFRFLSILKYYLGKLKIPLKFNDSISMSNKGVKAN